MVSLFPKGPFRVSRSFDTYSATMEVVNGEQEDERRQGRRESWKAGSARGRQGRRKSRVEGGQGPGQASAPRYELAGAEEVQVPQVRFLRPAGPRHRGRDRTLEERWNVGRILVLHGHYRESRPRPRESGRPAGRDLG